MMFVTTHHGANGCSGSKCLHSPRARVRSLPCPSRPARPRARSQVWWAPGCAQPRSVTPRLCVPLFPRNEHPGTPPQLQTQICSCPGLGLFLVKLFEVSLVLWGIEPWRRPGSSLASDWTSSGILDFLHALRGHKFLWGDVAMNGGSMVGERSSNPDGIVHVLFELRKVT